MHFIEQKKENQLLRYSQFCKKKPIQLYGINDWYKSEGEIFFVKQSSVAFLVHASHKEAIEPSIFDLLYLISYFELFKQQKQLVPIFEDRCRAYGITNDRKKN